MASDQWYVRIELWQGGPLAHNVAGRALVGYQEVLPGPEDDTRELYHRLVAVLERAGFEDFIAECEAEEPAPISTQDLAVCLAEAKLGNAVNADWAPFVCAIEGELRRRAMAAGHELRGDEREARRRPRQPDPEKVAEAEEASRQIPFTVALDFDGVMARYDGWKGEDVLGKPLDGLDLFLQRCSERGWHVVTHSVREAGRLVQWALGHNLDRYIAGYNVNPHAPENVKPGKPIAHVYVDDRGEPFPKNGGERPLQAYNALLKRLKEIEQEERT